MNHDLTLKFHPAADLFPLLNGVDLKALKDDIAEKGLIQPIVLFEGQILDGRNRYLACCELGITCESIEYTGDNPTAHAWSLNAQRRHLSTSQLGAIATSMLPLLQEEAAKRRSSGGANLKKGNRFPVRSNWTSPGDDNQGKAIAQAAAIVGVGATTIFRVNQVRKRDPELFKKIERGEITANAAHVKTQEGQKSRKKPTEARCEEIKNLAAEGYRSQQIASELGISTQHVRLIAREHDIQLPDGKIGKSHSIDPLGVIERTVHGLSGFAVGLQTIKKLNFTIPEAVALDFLEQLNFALRELNLLKARIKEISKCP